MASESFLLTGGLGGDRIWTGSLRIPSNLLAGGGTGYLTLVRQAGINIHIYIAPTPDGDPENQDPGPDFTTAVEEYAEAFTFMRADGSNPIIIAGPFGRPGETGEATEPYFWTPANGAQWQIWADANAGTDLILIINDGIESVPESLRGFAASAGRPTARFGQIEGRDKQREDLKGFAASAGQPTARFGQIEVRTAEPNLLRGFAASAGRPTARFGQTEVGDKPQEDLKGFAASAGRPTARFGQIEVRDAEPNLLRGFAASAGRPTARFGKTEVRDIPQEDLKGFAASAGQPTARFGKIEVGDYNALSVPLDFMATPENYDNHLDWDAPSEDGGGITGYKIEIATPTMQTFTVPNGADGKGWEFVFVRTNGVVRIGPPVPPENIVSSIAGRMRDEYLPEAPAGITDDAVGIDDMYRHEWAALRKWDQNLKIWGEFSVWFLWATFNEGQVFEDIFRLTSAENADGSPVLPQKPPNEPAIIDYVPPDWHDEGRPGLQTSPDFPYMWRWTRSRTGAGTFTDWGNLQKVEEYGQFKTAPVEILIRNDSPSSIPILPTAIATYTYATQMLTNLNQGWSVQDPGSASGRVLWRSRASAYSRRAFDFINPADWSTPSVVVIEPNPLEVEGNETVYRFGEGATGRDPPPTPTAATVGAIWVYTPLQATMDMPTVWKSARHRPEGENWGPWARPVLDDLYLPEFELPAYIPGRLHVTVFAEVSATLANILRSVGPTDNWPVEAVNVANTAIPDANTESGNLIGDVANLYRGDETAGYDFLQTRTWNGITWVAYQQAIDGNVLVNGSIIARLIAAEQIMANHIMARQINGNHVAAYTLRGENIIGNEIVGGHVLAGAIDAITGHFQTLGAMNLTVDLDADIKGTLTARHIDSDVNNVYPLYSGAVSIRSDNTPVLVTLNRQIPANMDVLQFTYLRTSGGNPQGHAVAACPFFGTTPVEAALSLGDRDGDVMGISVRQSGDFQLEIHGDPDGSWGSNAVVISIRSIIGINRPAPSPLQFIQPLRISVQPVLYVAPGDTVNVQPVATGGDTDHAQSWGMSIEPPLVGLSIDSGSGNITGIIPMGLIGNHNVVLTVATGALNRTAAMGLVISELGARLSDVTPTIGVAIGCTATGGGTNPVFLYQWQRDGAPIAGATGMNYTPVAADVDHLLRCRVRSSETGELTVYATAAAVVMGELSATLDTLSPRVNDTIFCTPSGGTEPYLFQWQADSSNIAGETSASYVVTADRVGQRIRCRARDSEGREVFTPATAAVAAAGSFVASLSPTVPVSENAVSAVPVGGTAPYTYNWQQFLSGTWQSLEAFTNGVETIRIYPISIGTLFRCQVTDSSVPPLMATATAAGVNIENPNPLRASLSPDQPSVGQAVTVVVTGGTGTISRQWQRDGTNIAGETGVTYTPVVADVGTRLSCEVSYTTGAPVVTFTVNAIAAANTAAAPAFTVSLNNYNPRVGDVLTCTVDGGSGPITYNWQWRSPLSSNQWTDADNETDESITVHAVSIGADLRCQATREGTTVNSPPTAAVLAAIVPTLTAVLNDYSPVIGQRLRCTASGGTGSYTYQWQNLVHVLLGWQDIAGETSRNYDVRTSDVGDLVRCCVSSGDATAYATTTTEVPAVIVPTLTAVLNDYSPVIGQRLRCTASGGTGSYTYQWQYVPHLLLGWQNRSGETSRRYDVRSSDAGSLLRCRVRSGDATAYATTTTEVPAATPPRPSFESNISLSLSDSETSDTIDMEDELTNVPSGADINWSETERDADFSARISSSGILTVTRSGTSSGSGIVTVTASYTVDGVTGPSRSVAVSITIAALDTGPPPLPSNYRRYAQHGTNTFFTRSEILDGRWSTSRDGRFPSGVGVSSPYGCLAVPDEAPNLSFYTILGDGDSDSLNYISQWTRRGTVTLPDGQGTDRTYRYWTNGPYTGFTLGSFRIRFY